MLGIDIWSALFEIISSVTGILKQSWPECNEAPVDEVGNLMEGPVGALEEEKIGVGAVLYDFDIYGYDQGSDTDGESVSVCA